jgi:hypothetical protein
MAAEKDAVQEAVQVPEPEQAPAANNGSVPVSAVREGEPDLKFADKEDSVDEPRPRMRTWVRAVLICLAVPWIVVLGIAIWLNPYTENGEARTFGTHQQLNLPPCTFQTMAGIPCPSCGMTTSFSLLMHADVWNSLKANFAGTVLASFGLLFIPWAIASAFLGRFMFIRNLELVVFRLSMVFLILLFGRWAIVVLIDFLQ